MTQAVQTAQYGSSSVGLAFKNRIINGAMVIDQRNAGASFAQINADYNLDRFFGFSFTSGATTGKYTVQQNAGSVTPPTGFTNYLGVTSTAATADNAANIYTISQRIEGFNVADLAWGTASAKTVTLSFWVRSSLTGTFGGSVFNSGGTIRAYPFSYNISAANTWEYKTVTIAGDTSGTWNTTNGIGLQLNFSLGVGSTYSGTAGAWATGSLYSTTGATSVVGTNGATWYVTGVQLEVGSTATSFDYRPYGTELQLCQRYYQLSAIFSGSAAYAINSTYYPYAIALGVAMRVSPSVPTPTNCGTLAVTSGGQDGYRTPLIYPTTAATSSSFYGIAASSEL